MQPQNAVSHKSYLWSVVAFGVILLGVLLRFYGLDRDSLWSDELFTVAAALDVGIDTHWLHFTPKIIQELTFEDSFITWKAADNTPPLFELALMGWAKLFGSSDFALRALPAVLGSLSIIFFYNGLKNVIDQKAVLLGTILFSISTPAVIYSQEVRSYTLTAFLGTIALIRLIRHIIVNKNSEHKLTPDIFIFILMAYSHYTGLYVAGLFAGIYMLFISLPQRKFIDAAKFLLVPLAVLPWLYLSKKAFLFSSAGGYGWREYGRSDIFDTMTLGTLNFFLPSAGIFFAILWIGCIALSLFQNDPSQGWSFTKKTLMSKAQEDAVRLAVLFLMCVFSLFLYSIYNAFTSKMWHPRYLLVVIPVISASFSLLFHATNVAKRFIFIFVVGVFGFFSFISLKNYYTNAGGKEDFRGAAQFISDSIEDGSLVILGWKPNEAIYRHYLTKSLSKSKKNYSIVAVSWSEDISNLCDSLKDTEKYIYIFQHQTHTFNLEMEKCGSVKSVNSYKFYGLRVDKYQAILQKSL